MWKLCGLLFIAALTSKFRVIQLIGILFVILQKDWIHYKFRIFKKENKAHTITILNHHSAWRLSTPLVSEHALQVPLLIECQVLSYGSRFGISDKEIEQLVPDPSNDGSDWITGIKTFGWSGGFRVSPPPAGINSRGGGVVSFFPLSAIGTTRH